MAIDESNLLTQNLVETSDKENVVDVTEDIPVLDVKPLEQNVSEEIEVAGRFRPGKIKERIKEATQEAEEKILPKGPPERVFLRDNKIIVRGIEEDELKNIEEFIPEAGEGVNFFKIVDQLEKIIPEIDANSVATVFENIKIKNRKLFEAAKRGKLSMEDMLKLAEKNGIIYNATKFLKKKPGQILPAEEFLAGILTVVNWRSEVKKAYQIAREINDPDVKNIEMEKVLRMAAVEEQLLANIAANLSEYGRGLSVVRNLSSLNLEIGPRSQALSAWVDSFDDSQTAEYMMEKYITLPDSGKGVFLEKSLASRTLDAVAEAYVMGVLTSLRTHAVNIASTGLNNVAQIPVDIVAGSIGYARTSLFGGNKRSYAKEWIYRAEGLRMSIMDAILISGKSWLKDEPSDFVSKIDLRRQKAWTAKKFNMDESKWYAKVFDWIGTYNRLSGRFLVAEDEFFKVLGASGELRVLAYRRSQELYEEIVDRVGEVEARKLQKEEYEKIMSNPPEDIREASSDAARYYAFQEPLTGMLEEVQGFMAHPAVKILGTAFFKTPSNVITQTAQYTPIFGGFKVIRDYNSGDPIAADRALAKVAIGSSVMATLSYLTWNGGYGENTFVTGTGPTDYKARQAWKRKGLLPYSLCSRDNENDAYTCTSYARFEPISGILAMAADFVYYAQHEDDLEMVAAIGNAATLAMAEYASQMPMLEGASDIAEIFNSVLYPTALDKSERLTQLITEKGTGAVLSGTPTFGAFARSIEQVIDQDASGYTLPPSGYAFSGGYGPLISELPAPLLGFYTALQKAMAGNPFFSDKVPPKLNRWGDVIPQGLGEYYEVVSPIRKSYEWRDGVTSPIDEELMSLGLGINMPPKKISGVRLNQEQYNEILKTAAFIDNNNKMPGDPGYKLEQALFNVIKDTMEGDLYQNYTTTDRYGATVTKPRTRQEKLQLINSLVNAADNRAIKYLRELDPTLDQLILRRE